MAADVAGLMLCGQGLVAAPSFRNQLRVNQIARCNGLAQPKLPREKFGNSSDESKTESRKGTRSGRRGSKPPGSARRFLHPMAETPTPPNPILTHPPPSLLSPPHRASSAASPLEAAHTAPPTRRAVSVLPDTNEGQNGGDAVPQEESGGGDGDARVATSDDPPASSSGADHGVAPLCAREPASTSDSHAPQAHRHQNQHQTGTSCSPRSTKGGQSSASVWDEADARLAVRKAPLTCARPTPAESQSARASSQVSAAADDAIQPRERSSATETKRDAAKCREDDVRCGGGRGGVVVISHTVLRIQPEARQARLRRPTRDHLPARTLTKAQTQNALDAASEQSELERVRAMKRIEDFKKMQDKRREDALKQQEDLRRKRVVERKAKEYEMERRRAEIYALNAIMSESELSQVEIYRKQIEVNTKERPSSFVELGEAFKNKVVGETKIHAV